MIHKNSDIPHILQTGPNCGATCLCMLLKAYKVKAKLKTISKFFMRPDSNGKDICWNSLMVRYMLELGISCCAVAATGLQIIPDALDLGLDVVLNYRPGENGNIGHYVVVTSWMDSILFVNDPALRYSKGNKKLMFHTDLQLKRLS